MVTVPTYSGGVNARGVATTARTGPGQEAFGGDVAKAVQGFGQTLDTTAGAVEKIVDMQAETRTREADVALSNHINDVLYGSDDALMKRQGSAFVDSAPVALKAIEAKVRELQGAPRNGLEGRMLSDVLERRLSQTRQQVQSNALREAEFAHKAAAAGRVATAGRDAAFTYRDPVAFNQRKAELDVALRDKLQAEGVNDPASYQAERMTQFSALNAYVINDRVRLGEIAEAQSDLDAAIVRGEMDPATAGRLQDMLEKTATDQEIGALVEGKAPDGGLSATLDKATPELVSAVVHQESRGNGLAVSPKGAQGVAQVMPGTGPEAAKLAGLPWEPSRMTSSKPEDVKYQLALGEAYLNAQIKRFGGSTVVALAAYNAGPARAEAWVKQFGDPAKGEISAKDWAAKIPYAETKDYVAKITARLGGSTKAALPPTTMTVAEAETWVQQFPVKDRDKARSAAMSVVNRNRAAKSQAESDAWDAAQPYLRNGGTWTSIPKTVWNKMDPVHQTSLMEAERKGENRETSPAALDAVYTLMEENPEGFKNADLLKLAPDFSKGDFEQLRRYQHEARRGTGEWKTPAAQYSAITRNLASVAPPSMIDGKSAGAKQQREQLKSRWWQAVQLKQSSQKEPLTDDEIVDIGTRLISETAMAPGYGQKTRPLYQFGPDPEKNQSIGYGSIPAAEKAKVAKFLQQRSGRVPSTGEVLDTWRTLKAIGELDAS